MPSEIYRLQNQAFSRHSGFGRARLEKIVFEKIMFDENHASENQSAGYDARTSFRFRVEQ